MYNRYYISTFSMKISFARIARRSHKMFNSFSLFAIINIRFLEISKN